MGFFILFLVLSLALIAGGILMIVKRNAFVSKSSVIMGTVIEIHKQYFKGSWHYNPIIEYYNEKINATEKYEHSVGTSKQRYKIGETVDLRYYKDEHKTQVLLNTWFNIWGAPMVLIFMGVMTAIITVFSRI